jgi:hypothetical protein
MVAVGDNSAEVTTMHLTRMLAAAAEQHAFAAELAASRQPQRLAARDRKRDHQAPMTCHRPQRAVFAAGQLPAGSAADGISREFVANPLT